MSERLLEMEGGCCQEPYIAQLTLVFSIETSRVQIPPTQLSIKISKKEIKGGCYI